MEELRIRGAENRDLEGLTLLYREVDEYHIRARPDLFRPAVGDVRPPDHYSKLLAQEDAGLLIARRRGVLAGFLEWYLRSAPEFPILQPRTWLLVDTLAVREEYRRQGIGHALMGAAEAIARERGAQTVELKVYGFNRSAVAFYEELGFSCEAHWYSKPCYTAREKNESKET